MGKLRVRTNLPSAKLTVYKGFTPVIENITISSTKTSPSGTDLFGYTDDKEFNLPKGIYSARISLPYCNPGDVKEFESGQMFYMPVVMEKTFIIRDQETADLTLLAHCEIKTLNDEL
jgi:hypothetical protein